MFNTKLKQEVTAIKNVIEEMMTEIAEFKENYENFLIWKNTVDEMTAEIANLKKDYGDYLEWRKMRDANEETAAKQGHFYISADDTALLERFIQEVNRDPDLAILMTTAGGTTVSLRTHPHTESKYSFAHKFEGGEA